MKLVLFNAGVSYGSIYVYLNVPDKVFDKNVLSIYFEWIKNKRSNVGLIVDLTSYLGEDVVKLQTCDRYSLSNDRDDYITRDSNCTISGRYNSKPFSSYSKERFQKEFLGDEFTGLVVKFKYSGGSKPMQERLVKVEFCDNDVISGYDLLETVKDGKNQYRQYKRNKISGQIEVVSS